MELTPNDVEQKAFTQALRGYQMDEVDDFLDEIVTSLRAYDQRLRDAQEKIRALENEASSRGGDETTISRAILVAQKTADSLLIEAKVEADGIREKAKAETELLSKEQEEERNRIRTQIEGMRDRVTGLRETLATLASAIGGQVDDMQAEIADAEAAVRPEPGTEADAEGSGSTGVAMDEDDPSATSDAGDLVVPGEAHEDDAEFAGEPESDPEVQPSSLDPSEDGDDDKGPDEDVPSRVSARPWERG